MFPDATLALRKVSQPTTLAHGGVGFRTFPSDSPLDVGPLTFLFGSIC